MRLLLVIAAVAAMVVAGMSRHHDAGAPAATRGRATAANAASPLLYFAGRWACAGGTPNGRTLVADVVFVPAMKDRWLEVRHIDHPPGRYESLSLWALGTPPESSITTYVYDNFGGSRRFTSQGWASDRIVWVRDTTESGARMETFTYLRVSDDTYWYAWHVRREPGGVLALGDSATCQRL